MIEQVNLVGVTGFEPATTCAQEMRNRGAILLNFNETGHKQAGQNGTKLPHMNQLVTRELFKPQIAAKCSIPLYPARCKSVILCLRIGSHHRNVLAKSRLSCADLAPSSRSCVPSLGNSRMSKLISFMAWKAVLRSSLLLTSSYAIRGCGAWRYPNPGQTSERSTTTSLICSTGCISV